MKQRRDLKADGNIGFVDTVSARALNMVGSSLSDFLHHAGAIPQRIGTSSLPAGMGRMTSILVARRQIARLVDQVMRLWSEYKIFEMLTEPRASSPTICSSSGGITSS